jgi:hypothetical protein
MFGKTYHHSQIYIGIYQIKSMNGNIIYYDDERNQMEMGRICSTQGANKNVDNISKEERVI